MALHALESPMPYEEYHHPGPLLVFLHGFPNNSSLWRDQLAFFKNHFHILSFNLPGSLRGGKFGSKVYSVDTIRAFILRTLEKVPEKEIILVGHDLGCFILNEVGRKLASRVLGQVFISGMGIDQYSYRLRNDPSQLMKSYYVFLFQLPIIPTLVKRFLKFPLKQTIYRSNHIHPNSLLAREAPHGFEPIGLYRSLASRMGENERRKSEIPTLFIFGSQDKFLNVPEREEVSRFYEYFDIRVVEGAGHWVNREKSEEVNHLLAHFIAIITKDSENLEDLSL